MCDKAKVCAKGDSGSNKECENYDEMIQTHVNQTCQFQDDCAKKIMSQIQKGEIDLTQCPGDPENKFEGTLNDILKNRPFLKDEFMTAAEETKADLRNLTESEF